jgi:hypothetical protein
VIENNNNNNNFENNNNNFDNFNGIEIESFFDILMENKKNGFLNDDQEVYLFFFL